MKKKKLGEVLRDRGMISPADLQKVIGEQQGKVIHLGELMLERGLVAKDDLGAALEEVSNIPYLDCGSIVPDPVRLEAGAPFDGGAPVRPALAKGTESPDCGHGRATKPCRLGRVAVYDGLGDFSAALLSDRAAAGHRKTLLHRRNAEGFLRDCPRGGGRAIRGTGVHFYQFAASQPGGHPGSTGRPAAEKNTGGASCFRSDSSGDGQAGQ